MTTAPRVTLTIVEHVAHVRLNRPEKRNGFDVAMFEALIETGERLIADRSVRAVVLAGEGKAFSAGLDWMSIMAAGAEAAEQLLSPSGSSPANAAQRSCWVWREVPVPVIAAVHGAVLGAGLQLALAADLRIAAPDSMLGALEVRYGLVPDMSASQVLLKLVRPDVARELLYTGRQVAADEALRLGLVTQLADDPVAAATSMALAIAAHSPHAVRAAKALCQGAPELSVAAALAFEATLQKQLIGTKNQLEAARAMMARDVPIFDDPT